VEVKFKAVSGKEDEAGGLVWRAPGREQLLRGAGECAGGQRDDLPYG